MTCLFQTRALASMTLAYSQLANTQQTCLTLSVQRPKLIKQRPLMFGTCAQQASRCGTFLQQHGRTQLLLCHALPLACFDQQCALQGTVVYHSMLPLAVNGMQAACDAMRHTAITAVASMMRRACTSAQQVSVAERVGDSWLHGNPRVAKISFTELGRMLTRSGINTG